MLPPSSAPPPSPSLRECESLVRADGRAMDFLDELSGWIVYKWNRKPSELRAWLRISNFGICSKIKF